MVGVNVDAHHPLHPPAVEQPLDSHRNVVVNAKAAGPLPRGMMHPATEVHSTNGLARQDGLRRQQRTAGEPGAGLVHPGERGIVLSSQATVLLGSRGIDTDAAHGLHVFAAVHSKKFDVGGHRRRFDGHMLVVKQAEGFGQPRCKFQPLRRHGVTRAKVVGSHGWIPHHRRWQCGPRNAGSCCSKP